ncbi:hypothetical protein [Tranquillimonas alkanivorans]|uniref:Uncharacterized protein n=1 Tax=Tranquillimonas alkanivorans TaxID=441119 RepID=A0A1I5WC99_9RHOB|nr:hypothetical protein [Tranquillimonas alkanivorans]SFQ16976.1 hypothetical protein SAMN04488047_1431 [Tranquillimonas alkanivorans]
MHKGRQPQRRLRSIFDQAKFLSSLGVDDILAVRSTHIAERFLRPDVGPGILRIGTITILDQHPEMLGFRAEVEILDEGGLRRAWQERNLAEEFLFCSRPPWDQPISEIARDICAVWTDLPAPLERGFEFVTPPDRWLETRDIYVLASLRECGVPFEEMHLSTYETEHELKQVVGQIECNNEVAYPDARLSLAGFRITESGQVLQIV